MNSETQPPSAVKRKLIEVALPLVAINSASAREKSIRFGHPSTLHLWWARRPLAAARASIFAQMVDDPSGHPDLFPTEEAQEAERQRLFRLIDELVQWENTNNEVILSRVRDEIWRSWRITCTENSGNPRAKELYDPKRLPRFHDPFAGGGALPLEAQRLGLESYATELNPVAVLINKAMIEIPPRFGGVPPVNPTIRGEKSLVARTWRRAQGLAEDVRFYGNWMRDEAQKRIGHLYPDIEITPDMATDRPDLRPLAGRKLTVIAWLWARTVKSPNPAFAHVDVPLISSFMLSSKNNQEAYIEPMIDGARYSFAVRIGKPKDTAAAVRGTKLTRGNFACLLSGSPISSEYIKTEAQAGRMTVRLLAIVADSDRGRVFLNATDAMTRIALEAKPTQKPDIEFFQHALGFRVGNYGMTKWSDLFTSRQLVALTTFTELIAEARSRAERDALSAGLPQHGAGLAAGGTGATAYADAVATYLAIALSRLTDMCNALCGWEATKTQVRHLFTRQAIPMLWDFAENNVFSDAAGAYLTSLANMARALDQMPASSPGIVSQADAQTQLVSIDKVVATDPPYYDNVGYADLADFFYVWLRPPLKEIFPDVFATVTTPKAEELVATPDRHGGREKAEAFFLDGMTSAMHRLAEQAHPAFPVIIYYAFKQAESDDKDGTASTGWETFLGAVIRAGFAISGTWPMRTELANRMRGMDSNALASSIVLVCRRRGSGGESATRREFLNLLKAELPLAIARLQHSNIAPVDLAQAAIGPGMAVYTRFSKVLDAQGKALSVREALALINQSLDEVLAEQEGDFDADTRWALAWFDQYGFSDGEYGVAETLSKAKNTSIAGLAEAGILTSRGGKVRLLQPTELADTWDPSGEARLTVWEIVHHLIRVLEANSEGAAAELMAKIGGKADAARELPYRLYTICERKKRAREALSYNGLVQSWPELSRLARDTSPRPAQTTMFERV
jgi:putative DNA methylase